MKPSIRHRLLLTLLAVTGTLWLLTVLESYHATQHEVEELFDAQLAQSARTLLTVAGHELAELGGIPDEAHIHFLPEDEPQGHEYELKLAYQLWMQPQNRLLVRSFRAPQSPLSTTPEGYSTAFIDGKPWRIFSLLDRNSGFQVMMGESLAIRSELSDEIALRMALPMLIALPLLALLIYLGIGRGLQPLQRLAHTITRREAGHLERVDSRNVPREIEPLVDALNQLFERLELSLEKERRFTADAAHELRTPLAALRVQAQVAQRSQDEGQRSRALEQLDKGIERASRLVEQLLTLARLDPQTAAQDFTPTALRPIAEEVIATLGPLASGKGIALHLRCDEAPAISAQAEGIAIALRNLVDNAIRYTPDGGEVEIGIERHDGAVTISVSDSGPGIAQEQREKIFDRFYRLAGQESEGSGLGLSIVQRIAELHGAEIVVGESPAGGVTMTLRFTESGTPQQG